MYERDIGMINKLELKIEEYKKIIELTTYTKEDIQKKIKQLKEDLKQLKRNLKQRKKDLNTTPWNGHRCIFGYWYD